MFIIFLKFTNNKKLAGQSLAEHNEWINQGLSEGVFLVVGSLHPNLGGGILAHNTTLTELEKRVQADPFVSRNIVTVEIFEFTPSKTNEQLRFLLEN